MRINEVLITGVMAEEVVKRTKRRKMIPTAVHHTHLIALASVCQAAGK